MEENKPADELVLSDSGIKEVKYVKELRLANEHHPFLKETMPTFDFTTMSKADRIELSNSMISTMKAYGGIGLSANQIGARIRMFVMRRVDPATGKDIETLVCFNPKVVSASEKLVAQREGCLSYPGLSLQIKRPYTITAQFQDERGDSFEREFGGLDARCFLHELDHMNGITFTSRVSRQLLDWEREKQRKLMKKVRKSYAKYS